MKFSELNLEDSVLQALDAMNFRECTPVQEHTIPVILEGKDLIGLAQTGGYIFAALGPVLFGSSKQLFNSWTPAVLILLVLTLIMGIALYKVEKT